MCGVDFSKISESYSEKSIIQKSAAEILIDLLQIRPNDNILDVGCGTGKLTACLSRFSRGEIIGIDPSEGMISQAKKQNKNTGILFKKLSAEQINYRNKFDIIFCNSTMQWFRDNDRVIRNFYFALKPGGKAGIQAPAKNIYSPNFIEAVKKVKKDTRTKNIFLNFRNPWFFFDSPEEYRKIFEKHKFIVSYCRINTIKSFHSPEDVFRIFSSGAAAGYLNPDYYSIPLPEEYQEVFNSIVMQEFINQCNENGQVELEFNRIYLIAHKQP